MIVKRGEFILYLDFMWTKSDHVLNKLKQNILKSNNSAGRWWKKTCGGAKQ